MFLTSLNDEKKQAFLNLAYYVANVDAKFTDDEQELLKAFAQEMGIPCQPVNMELEDILIELRSLPVEQKKIVFFELTALVTIDNDYSLVEKAVLEKTLEMLELSEKFMEKSHNQVNKIRDSYNACNELIFG